MRASTARTVSVDFDGVLHSFTSGWTGYTPEEGPEPGALAFIYSLIDAGYEPVVVSARADCDLGVEEIQSWLVRHGFPTLTVTNAKVSAVAYVDDRAVPYTPGSGDWRSVMASIERLGHVA